MEISRDAEALAQPFSNKLLDLMFTLPQHDMVLETNQMCEQKNLVKNNFTRVVTVENLVSCCSTIFDTQQT